MFVKAGIIFIPLVFWGYSSEARECFIEGKCTQSFPFSGKLVNNQYLCRTECQSSPFCNWFTYYKESSYCELHRQCIKIDNLACQDCLSGEKNCSAPEIKCWMTGRCSGEAFSTNVTQTSEECLKMCKESSECEWFSFDEIKRTCSLFVNCTELVGCDDCVSGNSKCEIGSKGMFKLQLSFM